MHKEQVEAIAQNIIERYFGEAGLLENIRETLRNSNVRVIKEGPSVEVAKGANLIQSMLISHSNLAQALGNAMELMQMLQNRIDEMEKAGGTMKQALLDLNARLAALESSRAQ